MQEANNLKKIINEDPLSEEAQEILVEARKRVAKKRAEELANKNRVKK
jgi:hypothetical protein